MPEALRFRTPAKDLLPKSEFSFKFFLEKISPDIPLHTLKSVPRNFEFWICFWGQIIVNQNLEKNRNFSPPQYFENTQNFHITRMKTFWKVYIGLARYAQRRYFLFKVEFVQKFKKGFFENFTSLLVRKPAKLDTVFWFLSYFTLKTTFTPLKLSEHSLHFYDDCGKKALL